MKLFKILIIPMVIILAIVSCSLDESAGPESGGGSDLKLVINEFLASNDACCTDENGEFDDWFEIYNNDTITIDIGGMYVSDSKNDYKQHQIPTTEPATTTIKPDSFIVIWCDGQPEQGVLHTNFALGSGGEDITLTESDGRTIIAELTYEAQTTDISEGRMPDASDNWQNFTTPTPGKSNNESVSKFPPSISNITISPETINAGDDVTIAAVVTDQDDDLASVTLTYGVADTISTEAVMTAAGDDYSVTIGPFEDGKIIFFFITAIDEEAQTDVSDTLSFQVGYIPPVLYINEFLASNDSCCTDENGEYDDWIEIYNPGSEAVDIGGMHISDDLGALTTWQIPDTAPDTTTIQAGGFLVLWADKQPEQGVLHVNIKLSGSGEDIALTAPNGTSVIDSYTYGEQTTDVSEGRKPDGSDTWMNFDTPTPGVSNN